jgi:RHS repeat-associated protein
VQSSGLRRVASRWTWIQQRAVSYRYDPLQRLTAATETPGTAYCSSYDLVGNRTQVWINGSPQPARTYDAANQVVGVSYDAAGNLLQDGTRTLGYDALSRLTSATARGTTTSYRYNGDGVLARQTANGTTTSYTQDLVAPLSQVLEHSTGSTTTSYRYGVERLLAVQGSTPTWYGTDALGSVRQTLTDGGTASAPTHYDPWGTPTQGTPPTFGFTGELQDAASGLVHLRARWYSPGQATFTSRDPFADFPTQPYSLHPYQYGYSNPVLYTDPSGQAVCIPPWVFGEEIGCDEQKEELGGGSGGGYFDGHCPEGIWDEKIQDCREVQVLTGTVVVVPGGSLAGQSLTKALEACANLLGIWAISKVSEEVSVDVTPKKQDTKTPLWRAVNDAELMQLTTTRTFQDWINASGYIATETKYFSLTLEGGMREAVILSQLKHERL